MTVAFGNFGLSLAVLVSLVAIFGSVASLHRAARWSIAAVFALLTVSSIALLTALVQSDFGVDYVARYTERALPFGYKLAAFWAGQEGSLLLWAWLLAGMSTIALFTLGKSRSSSELSAIAATLSVACGFFATLILFAANPFKIGAVAPQDGHGLNPMLQDPGMIAHPPTLFLGYAGYTIPFAMLIGALISGRKDNEWLASTRRWAIVSWLFLTIGIILGAQWAYVELGWGGYWAWDPVENASLLPWLTGTALLHSIMVQQHRGMFKKWNAWLIAATFLLCIFGTYLTRSGVIDSVHSFGKSLIGTFFLVFLAISIAFAIGLLVARRKLLKCEHQLDVLAGKEGFFLATNVLLVGMTLVTLIGTIFPIISEPLAGQPVTVGPSFYNKVVAPLGLLLVALMSVGPLLVYGKEATARLVRGSTIPLLVAIVVVGTTLFLGMKNVWALLAAAIAACAVTTIVTDLVRSVASRLRSHDEDVFAALVHLLSTNTRRYGAQLAHVGVIMIVVGITGSSLFVQKQVFELKPGESVQFAGRTLTLTEVHPVQDVNFEALQATLTLTDIAGRQTALKPQIRQYAKWEQLNSEVSIRSSWREDVYVTLAASDGKGGVTIQAIINPLVSWIWTGGVVLTVGGIVVLLPRPASIAATAPARAVRSGKLRVHASA